MKSFYQLYQLLEDNVPATGAPGATSSTAQVQGQQRVNQMVNQLLPTMGPLAQQAWPNVQPQFWIDVAQKGYKVASQM